MYTVKTPTLTTIPFTDCEKDYNNGHFERKQSSL